MEPKLFIGNLPHSTTENDLQALFSQAGKVDSVELIKDQDTGDSKGFAFLEMSSPSEAEKAISVFNGYSLSNRTIKVNIARPREERPSGGWYKDSPPKQPNRHANNRRNNTQRL